MLNKVKKALREGGIELLVYRAKRFALQRSASLIRFENKASRIKREELSRLRDVLIINGCHIAAPTRYRVDNVIEQLAYYGLESKSVFRDELSFDYLDRFCVFIFYRSPASDTVNAFIERARASNKTVIYDIDDLIFDVEYVKTIAHLKTLAKNDYDSYIWHVEALGQTLALADHATAPTAELAQELSHRVDQVHINRNLASTELCHLSEIATDNRSNLKVAESHEGSSKPIRIGYLSGSITHNPDLELVEPALVEVLDRYPEVTLVLAGNIDSSPQLAMRKNRIETIGFVDWRSLPKIIASLDISIAPLEDTLFNRAKSEIKWIEASLVKVPTVASNLGAFAEVVEHGRTGLLASTTSEWIESLASLTEDSDLRARIADQAHRHVMEHHTVQRSGRALIEFIRRVRKKVVVIVVPTLDLSGGLRVILEHAMVMHRNNCHVTFAVDSKTPPESFTYNTVEFPCIRAKRRLICTEVDIMIATLWTTVDFVRCQPGVSRKVYFVQNYEVDFYNELKDTQRKSAASSTYCYSKELEYLTISPWCKRWLESYYGVKSRFLPNGIDLSSFKDHSVARFSWHARAIHVLVEGNADDHYKNVSESMEIVKLLKKHHQIICHHLAYRAISMDACVDVTHYQVPLDKVAAVYGQCDVLIKSSTLESFSYPPLEMMATKGSVIVAENDGNKEYVEHEVNCLTYKAGRIEDAVLQFERLVGDEALRNKLADGGYETAHKRSWQSLERDILEFWLPNGGKEKNIVSF